MRNIKLVIIGDSGVGKTSFRGQYTSGQFSTAYRATIGTDFITKTLPHYNNPDESVVLQIWDTAGQERFSSLSAAFFRGADAVIMMFDVNQPKTLEGLKKWWDEFKLRAPISEEAAEDYCCVVVGNKVDLVERRAMLTDGDDSVSEDAAKAFLEDLIPLSSDVESEVAESLEGVDFHVISPNGHELRGNGHAIPTPKSGAPEEDLEGVGSSAPRSDSIDIRRHPSFLPSTSKTNGSASHGRYHKSKSRSTERSHFASTINTTLSMYHTPSSSLFDNYESAPTSPVITPPRTPPSNRLFERSLSLSPSASRSPSIRHPRRMTSSSSSSSALTITPGRLRPQHSPPSIAMSLDTDTVQDLSNGHIVLTESTPISPRSAPQYQPKPKPKPKPEKGPKLFFASAKSGSNVREVFEYIAKRVVVRQEYDEEREEAARSARGGYNGNIHLEDSRGLSLAGFTTGLKGVQCCGT